MLASTLLDGEVKNPYFLLIKAELVDTPTHWIILSENEDVP